MDCRKTVIFTHAILMNEDDFTVSLIDSVRKTGNYLSVTINNALLHYLSCNVTTKYHRGSCLSSADTCELSIRQQ